MMLRWLLIGTVLAGPVLAQTSTAPGPGAAGQARPARGPDQGSVSTPAPPASLGQTTGAANPDPKVQSMNEAEKAKVEKEGK